MKRIGGLWPQICSFDSLYAAWRAARRGKRTRKSVSAFALALESELLQLQRSLLDQTWCPGAYRQFTIYERKPRLISAAPFRDRVVHHALMRVIEPPLDKRFVDASFACRKGGGVHRAVDRYQRYANANTYVLKMDIAAYFPSIDHALLKSELRTRIKDPNVLWLCDTVIDHSPPNRSPVQHFSGDSLLTPLDRRSGIPIGNLTSQFFANLYLDRFDHWVLHGNVGGYIRYVDDIFVFGNCLDKLWQLVEQSRDYLARWRLRVHPRKVQVYRCSGRIDVLGYQVSATRRWLRNSNGYRFKRRLKQLAKDYQKQRIDWDSGVRPPIAAWCGHAKHGETQSLRESILFGRVFKRGAKT